MVDVEAEREALRKELENIERKLAAVEEECKKKTIEYQTAMEVQERLEQQATEQRRSMESALETANVELAEQRVELEASHGRVEALETQLSKIEAAGRDVERKLSTIISALRRTVGILPGDGVNKTRSRSISPRKG